MLLMGLAANHFSPDDPKFNDEDAWRNALSPPRLYDAVLAERRSGVQPQPIWDALEVEIAFLLNWASRRENFQDGHQLLHQTEDFQWHWDRNAASEYDVMHAWAVEGGLMEPDQDEDASADGGQGHDDANPGGGGDGGREGGRDGGGGGEPGEQVITELVTALHTASEACYTGDENRLAQALLQVEGPRQRMRDDMWSRRR